ncbi:hypothetical protein B9X75_05905 [Acinetobacter pittii]|nr:hypothetical protein B9X75_05905 [Acinetobacter pittii]
MEKSYLRKKVGIMQKFKILCMFFIKILCYFRLFFIQNHLFCTVFKHIIPFFQLSDFKSN